MKQNTGLIATLAIVLAFFGISQLPKSASNNRAAESGNNRTGAVSTTGGEQNSLKPYSACREISKRLKPFIQSLDENTELPGSCYPGKSPGGLTTVSAKVQFAIAFVPNPVTTHLPLDFDRAIEAIQQAVQDDNYSYNSSWFPWSNTPKDYSQVSEQAAEADQPRREQQPGIIAFRRALLNETDESPYSGGLLVFVVAEQPTGGINREQFRNALDWIDQFAALRTYTRKVRILGPMFSGSIPSMAAALAAFNNSKSFVPGSIQISSGTVSSELAFHWFQNFLKNSHFGSFETAMESDSLSLDRFCKYIKRDDYQLNRVAILSEDETAFGTPVNMGKKTPLCYEEKGGGAIYLYYPRDIATLRSAYEQQSIFSSGKQQTNGNSGSTTLRADLSDPAGNEHDTVRHYGGQLTSLAQEAMLTAITNAIQQKRIQFIVLRSTNSLDRIFLTQFLRRAYPAARIVINGTDLLFRRGQEGASLRGVMVLSTYPLLTWQQEWTGSLLHGKNGAYRIFGEDGAEGLYVAARVSLRDPSTDSIVPVGNYAPPAWALQSDPSDENRRPATWLSVIGHHQLWPLAVLNATTLKDNKPGSENDATSYIDPITSTWKDAPVFPDGDPYPLHVETELIVLIVLCSIWTVLHLMWCWRGSIAPQHSMLSLAYFAPINRRQHAVLIAIGSLLPCLVVAEIATTCGLLTWSLSGWRGLILTSLAALLVLVAVLAYWRNNNLPLVSGTETPSTVSTIWRRTVGMIAFGLFVVFLFDRFHFVDTYTNKANRVPLYWRSSHLLSGVSPLLPQVLIMGGLYLWFWFTLRGLTLFGDDRPLLPGLRNLPVTRKPKNLPLGESTRFGKVISMMPMFSRESAASPIERTALPLGVEYLKGLGLGVAFAAGLLTLLLRAEGLQTLGEKKFGWLILGWLCLSVGLILADTLQLWRTWRKLHSLLIYLDRVPLRRTLASLRGLSWKSVWAMSGHVLDERYCLISRQLESLRHLRNRLAAWDPQDNSEGIRQELLDRISNCQDSKGTAFAKWYVRLKPRAVWNIQPMRDLQEELAETAGFVLSNLLIPAWRKETKSLILYTKQEDDKAEDASAASIPSAAIPEHVLAGEEFFVLPYLGFIQNILGRVRTIVLGMLFLFVAVTLAVSSYPFDPLPMLGIMFLVVFAITGGTIILVYTEMHRDATLSHITNTRPGELGSHFWLQLIAFGIGPVLGLLTTLFPSLTDFVTSWLQPSVQALQ